MWNGVLIAYSEIALKSPPVRRRFINILVKNILNGLGGVNVKVGQFGGRIFLECNDVESICRILPYVFGVVYFAPCTHIKLENLKEFIRMNAANLIGNAKSFAVRARREGVHEFTSLDLERNIGKLIVEIAKCKVDLKNPERVIYIEVRGNECFIYNSRVKGPGGLPIGSSGRVVCLLSGGIDSPVAAWMMMKRGCIVYPLFAYFPRGGDESDLLRYIEVLKVLRHWSIGVPLRAYTYRHEHNLIEFRKAASKYTCILCRRMMYRVANELAKKVNAKAVVTGENLAQVASQTLSNLQTIDEASELPVFRPLIGFDKVESERIAKEIGTYDKSCIRVKTGCLPRTGCWAKPSKPATKSSLQDIKIIEERLNINELLKKSIESLKEIRV